MNGRQDLTVVPHYDTETERKKTKAVGKLIVFLLFVVVILLILRGCVFNKKERKNVDFIFDFHTSEVVVPDDGSPAYFYLTVSNFKEGKVDPYGFHYEIVIKPKDDSEGTFRYSNRKNPSDSSSFRGGGTVARLSCQRNLKIDGSLGTTKESVEYVIYAQLAEDSSKLSYSIDYELNQK